jgi:transcriptional regulator with XRE-family HTH domain
MPHLVGNRLRAARVAAGFSDINLFAKIMNVKVVRLRKIETGREPPSIDELVGIAELTHKSLDFLVRGE